MFETITSLHSSPPSVLIKNARATALIQSELRCKNNVLQSTKKVVTRCPLLRVKRTLKPQPSKVTALYNRPLPRLRSLLCLVQRSFPLRRDVVLNAVVLKDRVSDFEFSMRIAIEPSCIPDTIELMHCGLADWAKEGPRQNGLQPYEPFNVLRGYLNREPVYKARLGSRISHTQ